MSQDVEDPTLRRMERLLQLLIDRTINGTARWSTRNTGLDTDLTFHLSTPNFTVRLRESDTFSNSITVIDESGNQIIELSGFGEKRPRKEKALRLVAELISVVRKKTIRTSSDLDRIIADIEKL